MSVEYYSKLERGALALRGVWYTAEQVANSVQSGGPAHYSRIPPDRHGSEVSEGSLITRLRPPRLAA